MNLDPRPVAVAVAALIAAAGAHAAAGWRVLGTGTASGDFAVAFASGRVVEPEAVGVRVEVSRRQTVHVFAVVGCAKGGAIGTKHRHFVARAPFTNALPLPMRHPDQCTLAVTASISRGGRLSVSPLAR